MDLMPVIFVVIILLRGGQGYYVKGGKHRVRLWIGLLVTEYVAGARVGFEHVNLFLLPVPRKKGVGVVTIHIVLAVI